MTKPCSACLGVGAAVKKRGDCVTVAERKNNICLLAASCNGHKNCAEFFIKQGANVNYYDENIGYDRLNLYIQETGWSPVMCAAANGHIETVKLLLKSGADVNLGGGQSPLFTAALYGKSEFIKPLVDAGADLNRQNGDGESTFIKRPFMY